MPATSPAPTARPRATRPRAGDAPPPPIPPLRHRPGAEWLLALACTAALTAVGAVLMHAAWPFGSYCRCSLPRSFQIAVYNYGGEFMVIPLELAAFRLLTPPRAGPHRVLWTSVLVVLASVGAFGVLRMGLGTLLMGPRNPVIEFTVAFTVGFAAYAAAIAWEMARLSAWRIRGAAVAERRLQADLVNARLSTLLSQLHPHFLFNAMNSASSLIGSDVARATEMIGRLRELLGMALRAPREPLVRVAEEMRFLALYLQIEQVRFRDRLRFSVQVAPGAEDAVVPQMILQPLVENAVRHGIARGERGGTVAVSAQVREGATLVLRVEDNGTGLPHGRGGAAGGLGLPNTRSRLALRYGARQSFRLWSPPGGGTVAEIVVPARYEEADAAGGPAPGAPTAVDGPVPAGAVHAGAMPAGAMPAGDACPEPAAVADGRVPVRALWSLRRWWWVFVGFCLIEGTAADAMTLFRGVQGATWLVFGSMLADLIQNVLLTAAAVVVAFRWPVRRANALPIAGVLLAMLVGTVLLVHAAALVLGVPPAPLSEYWISLPMMAQGPVALLCLAYALRYALVSATREAETSAAEGALRGAELESLRSQVDREFLMGTLASIGELIPRDAEAADQVLCRLADLLRRILQQTSLEWVELAPELDTVRLYLAVKAAQGHAVELDAAIDPALLGHPVPRQVLLSWVMRITESAPRPVGPIHVSAGHDGAGELSVAVRVPVDAEFGPPARAVQRHLREMQRLFARTARFSLVREAAALHLRIDVPPG